MARSKRYRRKRSEGYADWGRTYKVDGVDYPSVTTVLNVLHVPALQQWHRNKALETGWEGARRGLTLQQVKSGELYRFPSVASPARFGTDVHATIEKILKGGEVPSGYQEGRRGAHVIAALGFLTQMKANPTHVEVGVYHPYKHYAGTADLFCTLADGRTALVDWKTGSDWPKHALQLVAYAEATRIIGFNSREKRKEYRCYDSGEEVPHVDVAFGVYTQDDSQWRVLEVDPQERWTVDTWNTALKAFHMVNMPEYANVGAQ